MMARTSLATEVHDTPQKGPRVPAGAPSYIVIHHAATLSLDAVVELEMGAREVSSTVIVKDGRVASMFDESFRAWSLSSQYWDSVSLSSETCNSGLAAEGWPISEESYATLAKLCADWCRRYSIPCDRTHIMGHREVYIRYGASYATACPGGIDLDRVVRETAAILNTSTPTNTRKEQRMFIRAKGSHEYVYDGYVFELEAGGHLRPLSSEEQGLVVANGYPIFDWKAQDVYNHSVKGGLWEFTGSSGQPDPGYLTGRLLFGRTADGKDYVRKLPGQQYR